MVIQEAAEMYLETILVLSQRNDVVRSIDIVNEMGISKPTVSEQMKKFRENGYITMNADGSIMLTPQSREIAERTYERHNALARIFTTIGVSEETARRDACRVEHYISQETFDCLRAYFLENKG